MFLLLIYCPRKKMYQLLRQIIIYPEKKMYVPKTIRVRSDAAQRYYYFYATQANSVFFIMYVIKTRDVLIESVITTY